MTEEQAKIVEETLKDASTYGTDNYETAVEYERRADHYAVHTFDREEGDEEFATGSTVEVRYFAEVQGRHLLLVVDERGDVVIEAVGGALFALFYA